MRVSVASRLVAVTGRGATVRAHPSARACAAPVNGTTPATGAAAAGSQSYDYSVVAVPRTEGVFDGTWTQADRNLVAAASRDATAGPPADEATVTLLGMSRSELTSFAIAEGQSAFRGQQLYDALYSKARYVHTLDDISTLPAAWRASLRDRGVTVGRSTIHAVSRSSDGTAKLLLRVADGRVVETVGIPEDEASKKRLTVCVSSQVGCPMRCTFCATGKGGFARNLRAHEVVDQVLHIEELFQRRASHVVFMGMGEPCLNLRHVLAAHRALNEDVGIGQRCMTISTVGVPNALAKLAEAGLQSTLAVSLHAPDQKTREAIIPSAKAYPLDALLADCVAYNTATGRRITFEYTLLAGVNDSEAQAKQLAQTLAKFGLQSHVNVIPYNPVDESQFERPSNNACRRFTDALQAAGCGASVRRTRGSDAAAACGQLRNEYQRKAGPVATPREM
jgi:23S rRNA (adenine2503-C2)-methyltransferase